MKKKLKPVRREIRIRVTKGGRKNKNWLRTDFLNAMIEQNPLIVKDLIIESAKIFWLPLICYESENLSLSKEQLNDICLDSIRKLHERIESIRAIQETLVQNEDEIESKDIEF